MRRQLTQAHTSIQGIFRIQAFVEIFYCVSFLEFEIEVRALKAEVVTLRHEITEQRSLTSTNSRKCSGFHTITDDDDLLWELESGAYCYTV